MGKRRRAAPRPPAGKQDVRGIPVDALVVEAGTYGDARSRM